MLRVKNRASRAIGVAAMVRQPLFSEATSDLGDPLVHRMPNDGAEQRSGGILLASAHSGQHFQLAQRLLFAARTRQ